MKKLPHAAFYINHNEDKDWLIQQLTEGKMLAGTISLNNLKGEVFSNKTLNYFIDEEIRHDHYEIEAGKSNTLNRSSSGEQRKALLQYLIAKKPDYIIIDSVFDSLDKLTRQSLQSTLQDLAATTLLIQLFSRKNELLHFIDQIYLFNSNKEMVCINQAVFFAQDDLKQSDLFTGYIPPPIKKYVLPPGPLVNMNQVAVQFDGRPILLDICWEINAGEFWQLTGPNGSGKSTLLSLITGNSPKGYGQDLTLFGHKKGSGETVWDLKEKIGYFTPSMTLQFERQDSIEQMIISGFFDSVGLYIVPSDIQIQLAREWLLLIGMYKIKNQPFRLFSEGHQRMILIARAMVKHPPLLILDEPTAGLDDEMATLFIALINKIADETTSAILYVSHKDEKGLSPDKVFDLIQTEKGSIGKILQ
jgi:molybdate transport system ATP-binding protein